MAKKRKSSDPSHAKLDRIVELLENLVMLKGRRYGLSRDEVRSILSLDAKRVSKVTKNIIVPE